VADGATGWTSREFAEIRAVRVRPAIQSFSLLTRSPDDPSFGDAEERRVSDGIEGEILGVSERARVAGNERLMFPERYRRALPWLDLKFGDVRGFAPFDWVTLVPASVSATGSLPEALEAAGATGLVWKPFLGGLPTATVTTGTVHELANPDSEPALVQRSSEWRVPEFMFRDGQGRMAVYSNGVRRLFRFSEGTAATADIEIDGDNAEPGRVQHVDMNMDGKKEWLVETLARYGDGFYSVLWILDGRTVPGRLRLERLPLSRSAGESASRDADASWEWRTDGTLQVTRGPAGQRQTVTYRYGDRLTQVRDSPK
jgi:hypothetical protein